MLQIDIKYLSQISSSLPRFKQLRDRLWNCRCILCGDSEHRKNLARGYFYVIKNTMNYKCHNCCEGMSFSNFLKKKFPSVHREYILEKFKATRGRKRHFETEEVVVAPVYSAEPPKFATKVVKPKFPLLSINELPENHETRKYVQSRLIPKDKWHLLYHTDDFRSFVVENINKQYVKLAANEKRLVIPFFDREGNLIGAQGRDLSGKGIRYITVRKSEKENLIFGLERVDLNQKIMMVEGPIDSLFLPNCLAAANADLYSAAMKTKIEMNKFIFIPDNQNRNAAVVKQIETLIEKNMQVCIWSARNTCKDINDMVKSGKTPDNLLKEITSSQVVGLAAKLKFESWRRT